VSFTSISDELTVVVEAFLINTDDFFATLVQRDLGAVFFFGHGF
jgi:hypothetical protein